MFVISSGLQPSVIFTDGDITYIGPFVIKQRITKQIIIMYKGWYIAYMLHNKRVCLIGVYKPSTHVTITAHFGIVANDVRIVVYDEYYKAPSEDTEFNINFICGGLRRDVYAGSWVLTTNINCNVLLNIVCWLL